MLGIPTSTGFCVPLDQSRGSPPPQRPAKSSLLPTSKVPLLQLSCHRAGIRSFEQEVVPCQYRCDCWWHFGPPRLFGLLLEGAQASPLSVAPDLPALAGGMAGRPEGLLPARKPLTSQGCPAKQPRAKKERCGALGINHKISSAKATIHAFLLLPGPGLCLAFAKHTIDFAECTIV